MGVGTGQPLPGRLHSGQDSRVRLQEGQDSTVLCSAGPPYLRRARRGARKTGHPSQVTNSCTGGVPHGGVARPGPQLRGSDCARAERQGFPPLLWGCQAWQGNKPGGPGAGQGAGLPSSAAGHRSGDAAAGPRRTLRSRCWAPNVHPRSLRPLTLPGVLRWGGLAWGWGGGRTSGEVPRSQRSSWGLAAGSGFPPLGPRVCMCARMCTCMCACACVYVRVFRGQGRVSRTAAADVRIQGPVRRPSPPAAASGGDEPGSSLPPGTPFRSLGRSSLLPRLAAGSGGKPATSACDRGPACGRGPRREFRMTRPAL